MRASWPAASTTVCTLVMPARAARGASEASRFGEVSKA
jgi:hypothetical protein